MAAPASSHIYAIALHPLTSESLTTSTNPSLPHSTEVVWSISVQTPSPSSSSDTTSSHLTHPSHPDIETDIFGPSNTHTHTHTSSQFTRSGGHGLHGEQDHVLVQILIGTPSTSSPISASTSLVRRVADTLSPIPPPPTTTTNYFPPWVAQAIVALQGAGLVSRFPIEPFLRFAKDTLEARQDGESVMVDYLAELARADGDHVEIGRGRDEVLQHVRTAEEQEQEPAVSTQQGGNVKQTGKGKTKGKGFLGFWVSRPRPVGKAHRTNREWYERQDEAYGGLM